MALGKHGVRLRSKIVAWSFFPTAIILTIVALVGFYAYQQVTETRTIESSRELARLSAGQLTAEFAEYGNILQSVSRLADFNDTGLLPLRAALARAANRLAIFDGGALILDTRGTIIATQPARPDLLGADWSDQTFYHDMVRSPGTIFSQFISPQKSGLRVVVVAVPITGGSGKLDGILVGMFRMGATSISPFYGSILKLRIGTNETAYLVDRRGVVLYHTDAEFIGNDFSGQPVVQALAQADSGAVRTKDLTGRDIVASYAPVLGTDWGLVVEQDWGTLLASGQDYGRFLLLLLILGLIVPAVVVTVSVRRITEPIAKLIGAAQEVAGGKFGQEIAVHTGDELEELVKQFNLMSAKLSETYAALQEREERFRLVTERANDGIWDWDINTGEVYYSPRWKGMLGYADHEIANRFDEWQRLLCPDDLPLAMAAIQSHLEGQTPVYNLEHRLRHKDGSYRWILARGIAIRDNSGRVSRMVGSHTDITERKQAEETIRQSEKRFAQIFNSSAIAISVTTFEEGRYVDANDAWLNLFGYTREEVIGNNTLQLNIWAQPEQRIGMIRQLKANASVRDFEHLARTKTGQVRDVLVSAEVTEIGNERYNLSMVLDITEQKRAAEELRRQNIYLAALHETTLGIMSRLDVTELLETTVTRAVDLVGAEYGWVYLVTPEKDAVRATTGTGLFTGNIGALLKAGEGLAGAVWKTEQPIAVADYQSWSGRASVFQGQPIGPVVGVPLRSSAEVVGVIGLTRAVAAPPFRPDEIDLMSRFAQLASIALENARLHTSVQAELSERQRAEDALEQRLELERLITNISTQFINLGPNEIDTGIQHALQAIGEFSGADRSYVFQYSKERARMSKTHEWCAPEIESNIERLQDFSLDHFPYIHQTMIQQNIMNIPRIADLPPEAINEREEFERQGVRSLLCVPIVYRGVDMGYLGFHTVRNEKNWNDSHATLLKITGEIFANALENQRAQAEVQAAYENLERRVQERTHELAALNTIASVVSRSLDLSEILTAALEKTLDAVGMEFGGAYRLEESEDGNGAEMTPRRFLNPLVYRGLSEAFVSHAGQWSLEPSSTQVALESGQPFVWRVEEASPKFGMMNALIEEGIQQVVTVPLLAQSRLVGALYLATGKARSLAPEQLSLLSAIGQQVGLAVDNARLYKAEQDRRAEAERRRQVAEGLREMLAILNSMLPLDEVLEHIVSQGRRLLQSDAAALFRLDRESQILSI
ncbi:MAG: GAF domain-containing protein, partial [Acidobacteriota bacterium]